jgi:predicted negative regulator of RcsB-dependent stress response
LNAYETDEEKVEALKKWWKDNGLSVVAGVGIGLAAVFGWRGWIGYQDSVAQQASAAFEQLLAAAEGGNTEVALKQAEVLAKDYGSTSYAAFAALMRARIELESGNTAAAQAALQDAIAKAPEPGLARIAALRLARILIDEGDLPGAKAVMDKHGDSGSFAGDFAALRGDIAAAEGRTQDARQAYQEALAAGAAAPDLLRLKLENLPPAG